MKNNITELVFILDRSGSMAGLEEDTIGGFNSLIKKQKRQKGSCFVSTVLFNHRSKVLYDRMPIAEVPPMTDKDYEVYGNTALLDAIGGAIHHIKNIHKYARPEDVPEHTLIVIMTDGMENASFQYSEQEVKTMIREQKAKYDWEFLFLGANIDAVSTAVNFGIGAYRSVNYHADSVGTRVAYDAIEETIRRVRKASPITSDWSKKIEEDYEKRK